MGTLAGEGVEVDQLQELMDAGPALVLVDLAELEHQLPDVTLTPYPVISEKVKSEPWWSSLDTARFLFAEYLKYILAIARMHLDTDAAS